MKRSRTDIAIRVLFIVCILTTLYFSNPRAALGYQDTADHSENAVTLYFFWGEGCPHCKTQKSFLDHLHQRYPQLNIKSFEAWYNKANARLYVEMARAFGAKPTGVPATFLGERVWIGFNRAIADEIESMVQTCTAQGCADPVMRLREPARPGMISQFDRSLSPLKPVCMHVFIKGNCPQCDGIIPYLDALTKKYNVELTMHDVLEEQQAALYGHFKETYGFDYGGYPALFIGDRYLLGDTAIRKNLEREIVACSRKGCVCPSKKIKGIAPYAPRPKDITPESGSVVDIPFLGSIDATAMSLPLMTVILGGLDSFNPCAFFVLFVLLGMLIHARSRARMAIIGGAFVLISGLAYFLFMAAWLNLFMVVGHLAAITVIAGIVALVVAGLNIKDYFFFGKGVSLVIPERAKPKLFKRMRALLKASSLTSMLIGTIVLAIGANTYELLCTAGFPMVFTRILTLHDLKGLGYYSYLALYTIVYVIPLLVIVAIFVITLGGKKLSEGHGQALKLLSGLMMLCLGIILIVNPALLNNIAVAAGMLAIVIVLAAAIVSTTGYIRRARESAEKAGKAMKMKRHKAHILFLCTGNSCRSQMAEGWTRHLLGDVMEPYSAGIEAHGLNPMAVRVMAEAGVDISHQQSKTFDALDAIAFDHVVTVCDSANEQCPLFIGTAKRLHQSFEDPARAKGGDDEKLAVYRRVRDEIKSFIESLPDILGIAHHGTKESGARTP